MTSCVAMRGATTEPASSDDLYDVLRWAAGLLREAKLPSEPIGELERLAEQVRQPCVVAVVGRVKAGKSTFVNALLGDDLAQVGTTETTATINHFRYGTPDAAYPVRCYWRSGHVTAESRAFLDRLQGNDIDTLRLATDIHHLEYLLPNPYLQDVTLVDTPGLAAVVDEHQQRTAEFMNLRDQLCERQHIETQRLSSEADAVIYVLGSIARASDAAFLEAFRDLSGGGSRAINAIGVLARIDVQPQILPQRHALVDRIARQLERELNAVYPISAGLQRALDTVDTDWLERCTAQLLSIPPATRAKLLDSEEFFLGLSPADCPISVEERINLRGDMPWGVFAAIGRVISSSGPDVGRITAELQDIAGFAPLRRALERVFFQRSRYLRHYRVLRDARRIISALTYDVLPAAHALSKQRQEKHQRFQRVLAGISDEFGDRSALMELVNANFAPFPDPAPRMAEIDRAFAVRFHRLEQHYADFRSLEHVERDPQAFSCTEREELRALFGLYGAELDDRLSGRYTLEYLDERQLHWSDLEQRDLQPIRREVAGQAASRYGLLLRQLLSPGGAGTQLA